MEIKELRKSIVVFLLLNKNDAFANTYSLMKVLAWWFGIIEFVDLKKEMIEEGLVIYHDVKYGHYELTDKAVENFRLNRTIFEREMKLHYPNQIERLESLFENLKP